MRHNVVIVTQKPIPPSVLAEHLGYHIEEGLGVRDGFLISVTNDDGTAELEYGGAQ